MSKDALLLGRLAVTYKLITQDQLAEILKQQARQEWKKNVGELLLEGKMLTQEQLDRLLEIQRDLIAKQAVREAEMAVPPSPAVQVPPAPAGSQPARVPSTARARESHPPERVERLVDKVLDYAVRQDASDIHFSAGERLFLRRRGELLLVGEKPLTRAQAARFINELLDADQLVALENFGQVDFAAALSGIARFRGNAYRHQAGSAVALRAIPFLPPSLNELGLPANLARLTAYQQGIVLLTGPAGSGKSSTLAALLRMINEERRDHVVTIEDPIEYVHAPARCSISQRQVGRDTVSFAQALKAALREDPDVIVIGELRDLETISLALTAAETGHLVLATLHTGSTIRTIDRIVGAFPPDRQSQVRTMFSESLRAIVSQRLVNRADGAGRVPALEVLLGSRPVANLIREQKTFQIRSILQTGSAHGMYLLDASLAQLVRERVISRDEALRHCDDPRLIPAA